MTGGVEQAGRRHLSKRQLTTNINRTWVNGREWVITKAEIRQ